MKRFWPMRQPKGIDANTGDCANFAEALGNLVGGTVVCAYASEGDAENEEPAHCALKTSDGKMWDVNGEVTKKELLRRTALMDRDETPFIREATYDFGYRAMREDDRIEKIAKWLKKSKRR